MDTATARMMLETVQAAHPRIVVNDKTVEVWRAALDGCDDGEAGDALLTLLRENEYQPTPAAILRVMRDNRARRHPEVKPDPRENIPIQDAAAQILADLAERKRARWTQRDAAR
jgi:hypothetical protein